MATDPLQSESPNPGEGEAVNPRRPKFKRYVKMVRMPPEAALRQSEVVKAAWTKFGDRTSAMDFLNTHHPELDGRPLEVAVASDDGLRAVERLLAALPPAKPASA